ncbi:DUF6527 family protein [Nocardioides renjunii]|uniref:DUF6527 family protein n=1 Tax=Nocardioides renjunii TaxID=3095075 RepID=UPI002B002C6A|nr:DUF6527 family protein [Nocardioides sp. S-34]WQQ23880.1 DUF6527 family protein [Nocardioides sp. S-34]
MGDAHVGRRWVVINLTRRLRRRPKARYTEAVTIRDRADLPEHLNPRRVYQLGEPAKWVVLECPCGRGHVLELNLAHPSRPEWSVFTNDGKEPSLSPSVDFKGERRCHFWLREGRVRWV